MATHNPKESRAHIRASLEYVFRGVGHEHTVGEIKHIGGNLISRSPIEIDQYGNLEAINLNRIEKEFLQQARLHTGKGEKLFKHYVISLAPTESLKTHQWLELCQEYMKDQGYDSTTKWLAVEHSDSRCKHVHILSCRVKADLNGSLVSTQDDYKKGLPSMRKYEIKFGLLELTNPENSFGKNVKKPKIKHYGSAALVNKTDDAAAIRNGFADLYRRSGKPSSMKGLVCGLAKRGIAVKVKQDSSGSIIGINYSIRKGVWISGSKVKATRFTWKNLQQQEQITYIPDRDDIALGICEAALEVTLRLREENIIFYAKYLKLELDRKNQLAYFRLKRAIDADLTIVLLLLILMILRLIFGIQIIEDFEIDFVSPDSKFEKDKIIDLENQGDLNDFQKMLTLHKHYCADGKLKNLAT